MKNGITYVILCRRGIQKSECPIVAQGNHCVECNFAYYVQREAAPVQEEEIKQEENDV